MTPQIRLVASRVSGKKRRSLASVALLLCHLRCLLAQCGARFLWEMRDRSLLFSLGGGFLDVAPRGSLLFCGRHKELLFA
jgi:hypothetical protein